MCGDGIKTRMLDCVRSDGKSVDPEFCQKVSYERMKGSSSNVLMESSNLKVLSVLGLGFIKILDSVIMTSSLWKRCPV